MDINSVGDIIPSKSYWECQDPLNTLISPTMPPKLVPEAKKVEEIVDKYLTDQKIQEIIEKTLESKAVQELITSIANAVIKPVLEKINKTTKEATDKSDQLQNNHSKLEKRVEDLEKQSKMKNIRILGLPEDTPT